MARTPAAGRVQRIFQTVHSGGLHRGGRQHARLGLLPAAARPRVADPVPLQQHRKGLHQPLHQLALRHDQPHPRHVAVLLPDYRGGAAPRRPSRRAARAADHRIGALPHGGVADGRRRAVAVHAHDRQELRTRNQLAGRRTPRPLPRHAGRLPLPERPLRHL